MDAEPTTLAALADDIRRSGARIVAVVGAPGAGKSTLAAALAGALGAAVLPMDGFHLPQARLVELGRRERMGASDTFDVAGFAAVLSAVAAQPQTGMPVLAPDFDRTVEEAVPDALTIPAEASVVIVEGNYLLLDSAGWGDLRTLFDLALYLDENEALRRQRLVQRHIDFGKSPADALAWVERVDDANALVIRAAAARADRVVRVN